LKRSNWLDIDSAVNWILESGIQNRSGGFHAWYDCEKESYSFVYPETTGYAISLLLQLYRMRKENILLEKVYASGDWLSRIWNENGAIFCKCFDESETWDKSQYTFDMGIIMSGLLNLYDATSDRRYLETSLEMADWLLSFQDSDGSFSPGYDASGKEINFPHWSQTKGCHHLKNALPLLKLYEITQNRKYVLSIEKLLKWGMRLWLNPGRFAAFQGAGETYAHAHCYAVEGLLFSSKLMDNVTNPSLLEHALYAAKWLSTIQNSDGSIWNWHNSEKDKTKVCDALSQALRIWIVTKEFANKDEAAKFSSSVEKGLNFLRRMQCLNGDKRSHGGVYYGEKSGEKIPHVNTWTTFFATDVSLLLSNNKNVSSIDLLF